MKQLSVAEKIRIILRRNDMTLGELADLLGQSRQNLSNKMSRNNFQEGDIRAAAEAMHCSVDIIFTLSDGSTI